MPVDELWDALVEVCGADTSEMTKSERGRFNKALKELREVNATPGEIKKRARLYQQRFSGVPVTPTGLAAHWSECKPPRSRYPVPETASTFSLKEARGKTALEFYDQPRQDSPVSPEQLRKNRERLANMIEGLHQMGDADADE